MPLASYKTILWQQNTISFVLVALLGTRALSSCQCVIVEHPYCIFKVTKHCLQICWKQITIVNEEWKRARLPFEVVCRDLMVLACVDSSNSVFDRLR